MADTPTSHLTPEKFVLLVSGYAGAGKTEVLQTLEDMGYTTVDNMPLRLVKNMMSDVEALPSRLALGVDVKNHDLTTHVDEAIESIKAAPGVSHKLLFLTCDEEEVLRRFNVTRRRHPLAVGRPLAESIALDKQIMSDMARLADEEFNTTGYSPGDLTRAIRARYAHDDKAGLQTFVMSFGFKHGLPREVDMVFDVRFLRNPYWDEALRMKTGLEADVAAYIMEDEAFAEAFGNMKKMVSHQLRQFEKLDRPYVTIGIGCTGGQHRSVLMAKTLENALKEEGFSSRLHHRDLHLAGL